jgi:hypothetical protein
VPDCLAEPEIFEEIARTCLCGGRRSHKFILSFDPESGRSFSQNREPKASVRQREADEHVFVRCDTGESVNK